MPRQTLILNRFDGGINSKDSQVITILNHVGHETNTPIGRKPGTSFSLGKGDLNPTTITAPDFYTETVDKNININANQQDIPDHFLVKADNLMVDSVGKLRVIGGFDFKSMPLEKLIRKGYGLLFFKSDYSSGSDFNSLGTNESSRYLALADKNGKVHIYDYDAGTPQWVADVITTGATVMVPVMFYTDGALRVVDGNFGSASSAKWLGYIKRSHFGVGINSWYSKDNDLKKPTYLLFDNSIVIPTAGEGFSIGVGETANGYWDAGTYQIACSFIYDEIQESLLYEPTTGNTFTVEESYKKMNFFVVANPDYNERISGARIYCRLNDTDDDWALIVDIDFADGIRGKLSSDYNPWEGMGSDFISTTGTIDTMQVDTFRTLNGYSQDEQSNSIGALGMGYKSVCVANRRAFVFGPKYKNENGQTVYHGDRIVYSEANKFDTFLSNNYLDIGINDGDEFVHGEVIANKLFAFKKDKLYIIDVASSFSIDWNLIAEFNNRGVYAPHCVFKTDIGLAWVNNSGCFFSTGDAPIELTENIGEEEWSGDFINTNCQIGYLPKSKQLLIIKNNSIEESNNSDVYIYDFRTKSFIVGLKSLTEAANNSISNFVLDDDDNLIMYKDGQHDIYYWRDLIESNSSVFEYISKEIDFGDKSRKKKIYALYLNYKLNASIIANATTDVGVSYSTDGGTSWTTIMTNIGTSTTYGYQKFSLSAIKCNTLMIKIKSDVAKKFELQSIEIDYRVISNRKIT